MGPIAPPNFPPLIFILSSHTSLPVACDVAKQLCELDPNLVPWDFLEPAQDVTECLIEIDFTVDLGDPRLHPHQDHILSAADYIDAHMGEDFFGAHAFAEWQMRREIGNDATLVFRDATWHHIKPFLTVAKPHEVLFVNLNNPFLIPYPEFTPFIARQILFPSLPSADEVVTRILEACK